MQKINRYICYGLIFSILIYKDVFANKDLFAIDAGHSKLQPGATSATGKPEFEFNSVLAQAISDLISSHGIQVVRIGFDGKITNIKERTQIANNARANFFLSIHHDSVQPQFLKQWQLNGKIQKYTNYASGFSLFVSRKNQNLKTSLDCAVAIGIALRKKGLHLSPHHAEKIHGENREWANKENGVYYFDDLIVLKTAKMPAVLLEAGVIVNPEEEKTIQKIETISKIAHAIETGLLDCKITESKSFKSDFKNRLLDLLSEDNTPYIMLPNM